MEGSRRQSTLRLSIFFILLSAVATGAATARDTITPTTPLADSETLVCTGEAFALGFFTPSGSNNSYVGLWYNQISEPDCHTILWVANRLNPLVGGSSGAVLSVTHDGRLTITSSNGSVVWTSPTSTVKLASAVAQLLDSGNLVVKQEGDNSGGKYGWQGFNYLTDTLIPGMRLGLDRTTGINRTLVAWATPTDPTPGPYEASMSVRGDPEFYLYQGPNPIFRSGPWDGNQPSGIPDMNTLKGFSFEFANDDKEVAFSYSSSTQALVSRLIMNYTGVIQRAVWVGDTNQWNYFWSVPKDSCDRFGYCGQYGQCDSNTSPVCSCLPGFETKDPSGWSLFGGRDACVRKHELGCGGSGRGADGFNAVRNVKLPRSENCTVDMSRDLSECRQSCLQSCSCIAYASADVRRGGRGCVMWVGGRLYDIRNFVSGGQDLYVRVAAVDVVGTGF